MRCAKCQSENVKIIDSRKSGNNSIKRRRYCMACGERFSTIEIPIGEYSALKVKECRFNTILNYLKGNINENENCT